ncbi:Isochorismatase hydrolase [Lenzites betulinus]|nr:Isochorismatase hydrolase [Lenzites betulinus]
MALSNSVDSLDIQSLPPLPDDEPKRVLISLDVQAGMLDDPPRGIPAASTVGQNIAAILAHARASPTPPRIVHIRNCGGPGEDDEPGAPGWQLVHTPLPGEFVIDKRKNNAFAGTELAELVPTDAEIVLIGLQSDFCIRATCSAALSRGNEVLLVRGAHATYDRVEVLNHGTITPAAVVESEIEGELEEAGVVLLEMKDLPSLFTDS